MVSQGVGSIFKRTDGRYFIYLPKDLVEDTSFPFPPTSKTRVKISFKPGENRLIVEPTENARSKRSK